MNLLVASSSCLRTDSDKPQQYKSKCNDRYNDMRKLLKKTNSKCEGVVSFFEGSCCWAPEVFGIFH